MSMTFAPVGADIDWETGRGFINVANANGCELLSWLGLEPSPYGEVSASDLAARCRRRLWPEFRNDSPAIEPRTTKQPGRCTVIHGGRPSGYLQAKAEMLLALCQEAGPDAVIAWD